MNSPVLPHSDNSNGDVSLMFRKHSPKNQPTNKFTLLPSKLGNSVEALESDAPIIPAVEVNAYQNNLPDSYNGNAIYDKNYVR